MSFRKAISFSLSVFLLFIFSLLPAAAEGGEAFNLQSSTVVDGDTDLSVHPVIELTFSKKVSELPLLDHNKDCFHLQDTTGTVVPLTVLFPDTQVQNRFQNQVFLVPEADLQPAANYTLTVDASLTEKKETQLGQTSVIHFTTAADETFAKASENEDLRLLGEDVLRYSTALPPAAGTVSPESVPNATTKTDASNEETSTRTIVLIAVPLLLLVLGYFLYRNLKASKEAPSKDA